MLVTGEDAVLITAGVVGSVVDVGTWKYSNRGQRVRIPKPESKAWRYALPSEAGEGTEDVTEDTGLSKLVLAFWPASELPCCLETMRKD